MKEDKGQEKDDREEKYDRERKRKGNDEERNRGR